MKRLAIFGSGLGSNAENICKYFIDSKDVKIVFICTNNKKAFIVNRAEKLNIPVVYTKKYELETFTKMEKTLKVFSIDFIILAGFLLKIPLKMINLYPKRIINIHPSLLPKYGGKGMYGDNVHRKVLKEKELESGITIHYVDQNYDEGEVFLQKKCIISKNENIDSLREKIRSLELSYFPPTIKKIVLKECQL